MYLGEDGCPETAFALHASTDTPVQICSAVQKPSLTTVSLTLVLVTVIGVSSTDGTSILPLLTVAPCVVSGEIAVPLSRLTAN